MSVCDRSKLTQLSTISFATFAYCVQSLFNNATILFNDRCEYDYVEISASPLSGERAGAISRKCGDWSRKVKLLRQVVTSFYAFLHFRADHSKRFRGFDVTVRIRQGIALINIDTCV